MTKYQRQDPELSRRKFINVALGTTAGIGGLSLISVVGGVRPPNKVTPEKELPRKGDILVHAEEGAQKGQPVKISELQANKAVYAYPKGKSLKGQEVVKDGVQRNQIVLLKFDPASLKPPTDIKGSPQGIVAYSRQCMHLGCNVEVKPYPPINLQEAMICPCHGGVYDPYQGAKVVAGPPPAVLPQLPVIVQGENLVVDGFFTSLPKDITEADFEAQKKELEKA